MAIPSGSFFSAKVAFGLTLLVVHGISGCTPAPQEHAAGPRNAREPDMAQSTRGPASAASPTNVKPAKQRVILFVWDGLRPDSVSATVTPNLARMRDGEGVNFSAQHAVYPTFTMMNAAAFATGAYPGRHGFYGNTEYQPGPSGSNAEGKPLDFSQPVFTEDHGVLRSLDAFYVAQGGRGLFMVDTLFQTAHAAGLRTAAIGKIGPAFLQDYRPDPLLTTHTRSDGELRVGRDRPGRRRRQHARHGVCERSALPRDAWLI